MKVVTCTLWPGNEIFIAIESQRSIFCNAVMLHLFGIPSAE